MSSYVDVVIDGRNEKYVQLDDGSFVPCNVAFSLEGGTLVKLPTAQIAALQTPTFPANFPLPSSQVSDLKAVTVGNLPTLYNIGNYPAGFNCLNLPATFPLSSAQEALLQAIKTFTDNLAKGAGAFDANTLRTVQARQAPAAVTRSSVAGSATAVSLVAANGGRSLLKIYNDSSAILYVGIGSTNPTATDFSTKLYQDDYYEAPFNEAGLEFRGIWSSATGAARITEGV